MRTQFSADVYTAVSKALENTNGHAARVIYNGTLVQLNVSGADLNVSEDKTRKRKAVFVERHQRGESQRLINYSVLMKRNRAITASLVRIPNPFSYSVGALQCLVDSRDVYPQLEEISEYLNEIAAVQYDTTAIYEPNLNVVFIESPAYRLMKYWTEMRGFGLLKSDIRYSGEDKADKIIENYPLIASLFLVSAAQNLTTFCNEFLMSKISLMRKYDPLFADMVLSNKGQLIFLGMDANDLMYNPLLSFGVRNECSSSNSISKGLIGTALEFGSMSSNVITVPLKNYKMYWCTSAGLCKAFGLKTKIQWSQAYALLFLYGKLSNASLVHVYSDPTVEDIAMLISQKYDEDPIWASVYNRNLFTFEDIYDYLYNSELQYV